MRRSAIVVLSDGQDTASLIGEPDIETVARDLSRQYTLAYAPEPPGEDSRFRRIRVRGPGHPGARPPTRAGSYTAGTAARR